MKLTRGIVLVAACCALSACGQGADKDTDADPSPTSATGTPSASASTPTPQPSPTTDFGPPARGPVVRGLGHTYRLPQGWANTTKAARRLEPRVSSVGTRMPRQDGFDDNVTVVTSLIPDATIDQIKSTVPQQLSSIVPQLKTWPAVTLDGTETIHHSGLAKAGPVTYFLDQYATINEDGELTVVTFSFNPKDAPLQRKRIVNSVLASWAWQPATTQPTSTVSP